MGDHARWSGLDYWTNNPAKTEFKKEAQYAGYDVEFDLWRSEGGMKAQGKFKVAMRASAKFRLHVTLPLAGVVCFSGPN